MFDSKSDYALNKLDREAIVCKTACGAYVRLTEADFSNREEFLKWKAISDQDYHDTETQQQEDDHCLSLHDHMGAAVPSAEEKLLAAIQSRAAMRRHSKVAPQNAARLFNFAAWSHDRAHRIQQQDKSADGGIRDGAEG